MQMMKACIFFLGALASPVVLSEDGNALPKALQTDQDNQDHANGHHGIHGHHGTHGHHKHRRASSIATQVRAYPSATTTALYTSTPTSTAIAGRTFRPIIIGFPTVHTQPAQKSMSERIKDVLTHDRERISSLAHQIRGWFR